MGWTGARGLRATARLGAALNLLSGVPDGFSVTVLRKLVVTGNAAATAANVLAAERTFRLGFVADLAGLLMFVASAVLLYRVFKPAGRALALLYLIFLVMGSIMQALEVVQDLAALSLLERGAGLAALSVPQANALALMFLRLHASTYQVGLFFDGCSDFMIAWIALRSTFLPRVFAPLMLVDALGVLTFTVGGFLSPPFATRVFPYLPMVPFAAGSGALYLWLIIRSVPAERWRTQALAMDRSAA